MAFTIPVGMADAGKGPTNRQLFLFQGDVAPKVGDILDTSSSFMLPSQLDLVDPLTERIVVSAREKMTPLPYSFIRENTCAHRTRSSPNPLDFTGPKPTRSRKATPRRRRTRWGFWQENKHPGASDNGTEQTH